MVDDFCNIQCQVFVGMMWCKQYYFFIWEEWVNGDFSQFFLFEFCKGICNFVWKYFYCDDILFMFDFWEYFFFVVWDISFYCIILVMIDFEFVKKQFDLFICEWYCYFNGQLFV